MDEVGRLFGANELIVAEVLQSAESMKAAVGHLEPRMSQTQTATRGKIVLATVKGDVHDIGKNLVEIILANNGFHVVNLGIKVPPEQLVLAVREHRPDMLGLSGLLVKSAHQMVATAEDLKRAGVEVPILVGGAALSRNFVDKNIAPAYTGTVAYAQDAMSGLELAKQIVDPQGHDRLRQELAERRAKLAQEVRERPKASAPVIPATRSKSVTLLEKVPAVPDYERHVLTNTPLDHIWKFINPVMLYGRHLGLRTSSRVLGTPAEAELSKTEEGRKALALKDAVEELKAFLRGGVMHARAVFQFFKAGSDGNRVLLFDGLTGEQKAAFDFPRQEKEEGLCLADYVLPLEGGVPRDNLAMFVTTAGSGIRELSEGFKAKGEFLKMHAVQALALETAEGYAELLHTQLRSMWGFPDKPDMTMLERFRAEYEGKRYSFGYPACPRLEDQAGLFAALRPEEIGVQLTEGFMMEPEASVSAVVFHHPQAHYFSVT
jgi:5-methyltetrahydrofolate--homocysteine methyltransferase